MEKLRELGSFSWQKAEEHLPQLKRSASKVLDNTKEHVIPSVKTAAAQVIKSGLPPVRKGVGFVVDTTRTVVFPLVITGGNYVWETVKEHPWLSGSLLLLLLWLGFTKPGTPGKMMKAPGRGGEKILRSAFEGDARGYFRDLRGKGP